MIFAGWVVYFVDGLFEGETTLGLLLWAAVLMPIGLATFYWRYNLITSTFVNGIEIPGRIIEINTLSTGKKRRDYIIDYEYKLNGQTYQYRNRVKKNTFAQTLKQGQNVHLLVNEKNPVLLLSKTFISSLYSMEFWDGRIESAPVEQNQPQALNQLIEEINNKRDNEWQKKDRRFSESFQPTTLHFLQRCSS